MKIEYLITFNQKKSLNLQKLKIMLRHFPIGFDSVTNS
jgi:hypothetical protein